MPNLKSNEFDAILLVAEKLSVLEGVAGFIKKALENAKEVGEALLV